MSLIIKIISHRSSPVMHHREGFDGDAIQLERLQRLDFVEKRRVYSLGRLAFCKPLEAIGMGVYRNGAGLDERFQTQHMVDMVMSNQDGLDAFQGDVVFSQHFLDLLCADAHIDQQAFVLLANIVAIAAAA